jgi:thioredoxin reductase (NADPH)
MPSVRNRAIARRHGIAILDHPTRIRLTATGCRIRSAEGDHEFDCLYPALGFKPKCRLASDVAARVDRHGEIIVNRHMQTSVPGLFAAGDCVSGLHQISVATGQAAVAATAIHNYLP